MFEVSTLSLLQHPNLVKMVGYCADGEQRLLVYEYLPSGSLKNHLFGTSNLHGSLSSYTWISYSICPIYEDSSSCAALHRTLNCSLRYSRLYFFASSTLNLCPYSLLEMAFFYFYRPSSGEKAIRLDCKNENCFRYCRRARVLT